MLLCLRNEFLKYPERRVFSEVLPSIRKEFRLDNNGNAFITIRGTARLLGVSHMALSGKNLPGKLAQTLAQKGFQVESFGTEGIPDVAFGYIAEYYAFKAGRWCKKQARQVCEAFLGIGVRLWIHAQLGWQKPQPEPQPQKALPSPEVIYGPHCPTGQDGPVNSEM